MRTHLIAIARLFAVKATSRCLSLALFVGAWHLTPVIAGAFRLKF